MLRAVFSRAECNFFPVFCDQVVQPARLSYPQGCLHNAIVEIDFFEFVH